MLSTFFRRGSTTTAAATLALLLSASLAGPAQAVTTTPAPAPVTSSLATADPDAAPTPFYESPAAVPAQAGQLIRSEASAFYLGPAKLVRLGKSSTRLMYTTTNAAGQVVPVTGTFIQSAAPWTGKGARPLVSYAPGTQGVANKCAPSYQGTEGVEYESVIVSAMLDAGYNVVITDYIGLGMKGPHTYMNRLDQGHAVLDAARVARNAGIGGTTAATPVGLAGYSQGGGASASAAELAPTYSPELPVKAAYAGAVPAELKPVIKQIDGSLYTAFIMYSSQGLLEASGIAPSAYLNAAGLKAYTATNAQCTVGAMPITAFAATKNFTTSGLPMSTLAMSEPFASRLDAQGIGFGRAPKIPVLISHSVLDDVIPYAVGKGLAQRWCAQGTRVTLETTVGVTHLGGYAAAVPRVMIFLGRQFAGLPNVNSCGVL